MIGPLFLSGFMGAGKSTVGRVAAGRAGVPFVDLDAEIERRAGATIAELFASRGEPAFRALEREVLTEQLADPSPRVVALGGGALLDRETRLTALERGTIITLQASAATLMSRAGRDGRRPLLAGGGEPQVAALLAARAEGYAEAHARVDSSGPPTEVATRVLEIWAGGDVAVALGHRSYSVRVRTDDRELGKVVDASGASRVLVITDGNVAPFVEADVREVLGSRLAAFHVIEPGERSKSIEGLLGGWMAARSAKLDRGALIVGIGGGVVTDLSGFVAGTWLRGIRWVAAPTSVLGMVDAAIGGKTGIDFGAAKNAIGAFHQPLAVCTNVARARTEPRRSFVSGLAEVVKSALVGDASLLGDLERDAEAILSGDLDALYRAIRAAAAVKASIVSRDEHEAGLRAVLNLGHTLGHALESAGGFGRWLHGEAVSLGTVAALRVGVELGRTPAGLPERVEALLARLGLPVHLDRAEVEAALPLLALDKKRSDDAVRFVFVTAPGKAEFAPISLVELGGRFLRAAE